MIAASIGMEAVFELGRTLPDVEEGTYYGARALKVNGRMMACTPRNKSAEINSVVVAMDLERRAAVLKQSPQLYYITDHYAPYPTVLIRLSRISPSELEGALRLAWEFAVSGSETQRSPRKSKRRHS